MKKFLVLLTALVLVIGTLAIPVAAQASDNVNGVKVVMSVIDKGDVKVSCEEILVSDIDKDGKFTIGEALVAVHEKFCASGAEGFKYEDGQYGPYITMLWGENTSAVGYMLNNRKVVRYKQISKPVFFLQFFKQVDYLCLN